MNLEEANEILDKIGDWTIVKTEKEYGVKLYQLLYDCEYIAEEWLVTDGILLKDVLTRIVRLEKEWSYEKGKNDTQNKIKEAIGL